MNNLSARQRAILAYIRGCDLPPTVREIRDDCNISSISVVSGDLDVLEALGYITRSEPNERGIRPARSIRVVGDDRPIDRLRKQLAAALAEAARWRARAEALADELERVRGG